LFIFGIITAVLGFLLLLFSALLTVTIVLLLIPYLPGNWWKKGLVLTVATPLIYWLSLHLSVQLLGVILNPPEWLLRILTPVTMVANMILRFIMLLPTLNDIYYNVMFVLFG
jgi:hypothetical protein